MQLRLSKCYDRRGGCSIMEYVVIPDTAIIAVNRGKQENQSSNIVYRDKNGELHSIDFETCAVNFKEEHGNASGVCIGERKIDECYFIFYTSGIKTKVVFTHKYVSNIFRYHLLRGSKTHRFLVTNFISNNPPGYFK